MKANELRIGNLLQDKISKTLLRVTELTEKNIITYVVDRNMFPLKEGWSLEPVPLTEDILLKCGAIKDNSDFGGYIIYFPNGNGMRIKDNKWSTQHIVVELKYLHQLQNLYFALTNTELEIKL